MWGSAYNLPHNLYVYQSDESTAREILDLAPRESLDQETLLVSSRFSSKLWAIIGSALVAALVVIMIVSWASRPD